MFRYLFVTPNICYGLHGEHQQHHNHHHLGVNRWVTVTLKDIATDPDLGKLTQFPQAIGKKAGSYYNFTKEQSIEFMRGYLHEFRRLAGDPDYAEFLTMPEDYKFTFYATGCQGSEYCYIPKTIIERYHPD